MKEIINKTFYCKQSSLNYVKHYLTIFELKYSFIGLYKFEAIPLSHTAFLNIERLNSDLKDSPDCLDLAYLQPKYTQEMFQKHLCPQGAKFRFIFSVEAKTARNK